MENTTESTKLLMFSNNDGGAEYWIRFIDTEGYIKWYSPLREVWASPLTIEKLERRLEVQTKREKNMQLIINSIVRQQGLKPVSKVKSEEVYHNVDDGYRYR